MSVYVISNAVPTPEEMGEILGLSSDRVSALRRIMDTPIRLESLGLKGGVVRVAAVNKSGRSRMANRTAAKK